MEKNKENMENYFFSILPRKENKYKYEIYKNIVNTMNDKFNYILILIGIIMVLSSSYNMVNYHNKLIYYQELRDSTPEDFKELYMKFPELGNDENLNNINMALSNSLVSSTWEYQSLRNSSFLNIVIGIILIYGGLKYTKK